MPSVAARRQPACPQDSSGDRDGSVRAPGCLARRHRLAVAVLVYSRMNRRSSSGPDCPSSHAETAQRRRIEGRLDGVVTGANHPAKGVREESRSQTPATPTPVHGQPSDQRHGNRIVSRRRVSSGGNAVRSMLAALRV